MQNMNKKDDDEVSKLRNEIAELKSINEKILKELQK
jgi:hypothetical protein